jgi:hypothetical protein
VPGAHEPQAEQANLAREGLPLLIIKRAHE